MTLLTMAFGAIHGILLAGAGWALHRLARRTPQRPMPTLWPPVRVVVPFEGGSPALGATLDDLAAQEYPGGFEIHLACEADDGAGRRAAGDWMAARPGGAAPVVRLALAEDTRACSRKNRNLLAALTLPCPANAVMVFTDSGYRRPLDWLRELVAPVAAIGARVATGYYHAEGSRGGRPSWRAVTGQLLFLVQQFPGLRQPWGGAMAISRRLFEDLQVAGLWSASIVDDVALAERLREEGIPVALVNRPALTAPAAGGRPFGWAGWFTRQIAYIRSLQPGAWRGIGIGLWLLAAGVAWMAGLLAMAWHPAVPRELAGAAALDLALLTAAGFFLRAKHPCPGTHRGWWTAYWGFMLAAPFCHLRTAVSRTIRWRGTTYRVGRGGRVLEQQGR